MGNMDRKLTEQRNQLIETILDECGGGITQTDLLEELDRRATEYGYKKAVGKPAKGTFYSYINSKECKWEYNRKEKRYIPFSPQSSSYFALTRLLPSLINSIRYVGNENITLSRADMTDQSVYTATLNDINVKAYAANNSNTPYHLLITLNKHQYETIISELIYSDCNYVSHIIPGICGIQVYFNAPDDVYTFCYYLISVMIALYIPKQYSVYVNNQVRSHANDFTNIEVEDDDDKYKDDLMTFQE